MNKLTGFLYARPSLIEGNTLQVYNSSLSPEQADFLALSSDWYVIGDDLRTLKAYDILEPGLDRKIFALAEKQAEHRVEFERPSISIWA